MGWVKGLAVLSVTAVSHMGLVTLDIEATINSQHSSENRVCEALYIIKLLLLIMLY